MGQDLKAELEAASQAYENMEADATRTIGEAESRANQAESQVQGLRDELSAAADAFKTMEADAASTIEGLQAKPSGTCRTSPNGPLSRPSRPRLSSRPSSSKARV